MCPPLNVAQLHAILDVAQIGHIETVDLDLEFGQGGHDVDYFIEKGVESVEGTDPEVVCISCKTAQFPFSALFTRRYKILHPETKVVIGGWMPTLAPELTLRLSGCSAVIRGEGERSLPRLIQGINQEKWPIDGVSYIELGEERRIVHNPNSTVLTLEELDHLPFPRYDILPDLKRYQPNRRGFSFTVEASRGCPNHRCIFCWNSTKNCDTSWRAKSPKRVAQEISYLVDNWSARLIFFADDSFGTDASWLRGFTSTMKGTFKTGEIAYVASMRVDSLRGVSLKELRQSGLHTIFHGIESGSPRMWETLGKNFKPEVTREYVLRLAAKELEAGIVPIFSLMIGLPGETEQDLDATISLCEQLAKLGSLFAFHILAPYEGTELVEHDRALLQPRDLYKEFGESESFLPEFHTVFGSRLDEFKDCLPDHRWVRPVMPIEVFREKYCILDKIVSSGKMSEYEQVNLETNPQAGTQTIKDLGQRPKLEDCFEGIVRRFRKGKK